MMKLLPPDDLGRKKIFISYRRQDAAAFAGRLNDQLEACFGNDALFMDVASIEFGADFEEEIAKSMKQCHVLLAVIGPNWTSSCDSNGNRRLDDPRDFVRLEISAALDHNIKVIPIWIEDTEIPSPADLPHDLQELPRKQGLRVRHESFKEDVNRLVDFIRNYFAKEQEADKETAQIPIVSHQDNDDDSIPENPKLVTEPEKYTNQEVENAKSAGPVVEKGGYKTWKLLGPAALLVFLIVYVCYSLIHHFVNPSTPNTSSPPREGFAEVEMLLPDLIVKSISEPREVEERMATAENAPPVANADGIEVFTDVSVTIMNEGTASSEPTKIRIVDLGKPESPIIRNIPALAIGEEHTEVIAFSYSLSMRNSVIEVIVDPDHEIEELSENNNRRITTAKRPGDLVED